MSSPDEPHVEAVDLSVRYTRGDTEVLALTNASFSIPRGQFVCVMGPSGSGKSTLLHVLSGLMAPSSGRVRIAGTDLHALSDDEATRFRRHHVGLVFQFFNLVPTLDVEHNVALPLLADGVRLAEVRDRVAALLDRLGVGHRIRHEVAALSGGEMQRVAIARALLPGPALILADEPTGSLDSKTGGEILTLLRGACDEDGITVVLMTHDPRSLARADRLLEMRDGRIEGDRLEPGGVDVG